MKVLVHQSSFSLYHLKWSLYTFLFVIQGIFILNMLTLDASLTQSVYHRCHIFDILVHRSRIKPYTDSFIFNRIQNICLVLLQNFYFLPFTFVHYRIIFVSYCSLSFVSCLVCHSVCIFVCLVVDYPYPKLLCCYGQFALISYFNERFQIKMI